MRKKRERREKFGAKFWRRFWPAVFCDVFLRRCSSGGSHPRVLLSAVRLCAVCACRCGDGPRLGGRPGGAMAFAPFFLTLSLSLSPCCVWLFWQTPRPDAIMPVCINQIKQAKKQNEYFVVNEQEVDKVRPGRGRSERRVTVRRAWPFVLSSFSSFRLCALPAASGNQRAGEYWCKGAHV